VTFNRVLIANRGEIAVRLVRACHAAGCEAVVVVSTADRDTLAARMADQVVCIGPPRPALSYLNRTAVVSAALISRCDALHPGYGFLAEDPELALLCEQQSLSFVGPASDTIRLMGDKVSARATAAAVGLPIVPGRDRVASAAEARHAAEDIGYPLLLKAAAGGGGSGIRLVVGPEQIESAFDHASAEALSAFGNATLFVERYIGDARHIEVQLLGDGAGEVIHLGDRDCSLQRRRQKVVEEAPTSIVSDDVRTSIVGGAVDLAKSIRYRNAGTAEFIYDNETGEHYFLEMNTRIQVEHPVTEEVTGIDVARAQLTIADGQGLPCEQHDVSIHGHAIECRLTAESSIGFRPSPGLITRWSPPDLPHVRLDTHCYDGYVVPPYYDSLLGKLIVWGIDRDAAIDRTVAALSAFDIDGIDTTLDLLGHVVAHEDFRNQCFNTAWLEPAAAEYAAARPLRRSS
jgi:acetyl-CoA carboxylase, biotin carboxylase subunit